MFHWYAGLVEPGLPARGIHGLIRRQALELGRDADAGGRTKYVVDLALTQHPAVKRFDLVTRDVYDPAVSIFPGQVSLPIRSTLLMCPTGIFRYRLCAHHPASDLTLCLQLAPGRSKSLASRWAFLCLRFSKAAVRPRQSYQAQPDDPQQSVRWS